MTRSLIGSRSTDHTAVGAGWAGAVSELAGSHLFVNNNNAFLVQIIFRTTPSAHFEGIPVYWCLQKSLHSSKTFVQIYSKKGNRSNDIIYKAQIDLYKAQIELYKARRSGFYMNFNKNFTQTSCFGNEYVVKT